MGWEERMPGRRKGVCFYIVYIKTDILYEDIILCMVYF